MLSGASARTRPPTAEMRTRSSATRCTGTGMSVARRGGEAAQSEIGFAGARCAGDERGAAADGDGRAVMRVSRVAHWGPLRAGSWGRDRQAHGEARSGWGSVVRRALLVAVLGDDLAGVRQHDLARNAEAEAGVLAAARVGRRPVGIEAVEDDLQAVAGNARAFVLDEDLDERRRRARVHRHRAALGRERDGIVDEVGQHLAEPALVALDAEGAAGTARCRRRASARGCRRR